VACIGRVEDVSRTVTMQLTGGGNRMFLLGERTQHLGGSVAASIAGLQDGPLPPIDYVEANASIRTVFEAIRSGSITAAHDISDGGVVACVAEMCLGGDAVGKIGARLAPPAHWAIDIERDAALFGEAGGFVVEVPSARVDAFEAVCTATGARPVAIGVTGGSSLAVEGLCAIPLDRLAAAWSSPLRELFD